MTLLGLSCAYFQGEQKAGICSSNQGKEMISVIWEEQVGLKDASHQDQGGKGSVPNTVKCFFCPWAGKITPCASVSLLKLSFS